MPFDPEKPYNDLPPLPPGIEIETKKILKKSISASRQLSELNGAITKLPNPHLFIDSINLQEARDSSAIENIITTRDELFKASIADKKIDNPSTKEVLHYRYALRYGFEELSARPFLTTNLFVSIVQKIKQNKAGIRNTPGTRLKNSIGKIIYTPPEGEELIRHKLKQLEDFIHNPDNIDAYNIDPLIKMALIHYQFEAVHPFSDGNGRTGRILLVLYLHFSGLLKLPALYLSKFIIENREDYYRNLREVTEKGNWENWIVYMLEMIEQTASEGLRTIESIEELMRTTGHELQLKYPKIYSIDLLHVIFKLPYTKRQFLVEAGLGNLKTVGNYLNKLESAGFLKSEQVGKEKLYLNEPLMQLLSVDKLPSEPITPGFKKDLLELKPKRTKTTGKENVEVETEFEINKDSRFILLVESANEKQQFVVYLSIRTDRNDHKWIGFGNVHDIINQYRSEHVFRIGYPNSTSYTITENILDKIRESGLTLDGNPQMIDKIRFRSDIDDELTIDYYYKLFKLRRNTNRR